MTPFSTRGAAVAALLAASSCGGPEPGDETRAEQAAAFVRGGGLAAEADAAWAAGDRARAADLYEAALRDRPSVSRDAYLRLAERLQDEGALDAACAWLERGRACFPGDIPLLRRLGDVLEQRGLLSRALECHEAVLARKPADPEALAALRRVKATLRAVPAPGDAQTP